MKTLETEKATISKISTALKLLPLNEFIDVFIQVFLLKCTNISRALPNLQACKAKNVPPNPSAHKKLSLRS